MFYWVMERRRAVVLGVIGAVIALFPAVGWAAGTPEDLVRAYVRTFLARDYAEVYALVSEADRQVKPEADYLRENVSFTEFALEAARALAARAELPTVEATVTGDRATVDAAVRLPDANAPALQALFREWDEAALNALVPADRRALRDELTRMARAGQIPMIEGRETFEAVRERGEWRLAMGWVAAIPVKFSGEAKMDLPWKFWAVQPVVLAKPGETLRTVYRAKNVSDKPVTAKALHRIEPREAAEKYLDIIQCFCFVEDTLQPGEEKEFPLTFRIRFEVPEAVREFRVHYEFYPAALFRKEWEQKQ